MFKPIWGQWVIVDTVIHKTLRLKGSKSNALYLKWDGNQGVVLHHYALLASKLCSWHFPKQQPFRVDRISLLYCILVSEAYYYTWLKEAWGENWGRGLWRQLRKSGFSRVCTFCIWLATQNHLATTSSPDVEGDADQYRLLTTIFLHQPTFCVLVLVIAPFFSKLLGKRP